MSKISELTKAIGFLLLLSSAGQLYAQKESETFSLKECLKYAVEKNSAIASARIQEDIAHAKVTEVIGSGLPQISIGGNLTNNLALPVQIIPGEIFGGSPGSEFRAKFGSKYNTSITGQVTQMIFNGAFWVGLDAAKQSNEYYSLGTETAIDNTLYAVSVSFYKTLIVEKQIKLLEYNVSTMSKALADTKIIRDNGKAKDLDVERLQVGYNNLTHQLDNAREQLKQAYNGLKFQMGMPVRQQLVVSDSTLENPAAYTGSNVTGLDEAAENMGSHKDRADYRQLLSVKELQELNRKNEISRYLPSINAFGNYAWALQKNTFEYPSKDWYNYYSVGLQFSLPVFNGGQTQAKIQQAELNVRQVEEQLKQADRGIDMEISNAQITLHNALSKIEIEQENLELAKKVYGKTQLEYNEGVTTSATLIDAENKSREAQTNYINSLLAFYIARFELEKAKGTIKSYIETVNQTK